MERPKVFSFSYNFFYPVPFALCLLVIRRILERYSFEQIGVSLGIRPLKVAHNQNTSALKSTLKSMNLLSPNQLSSISKYLYTLNTLIKSESQSQKIARFSRSCWHFVYYLVEFTHGMVILWDKPWLWNIKECWTDYPHEKISNDIWFYYVINLAYYWSLLIKLFIEERRKDFKESVVHHTLAIFLIYISFVMNVHRIGTLVMIVLFVSDIFLELAKLLKYLNMDLQTQIAFVFFSLVWTLSRLVIYPFWILRHTLLDAPIQITMTPSTYLLNVLLCSIVVLNIYWTYQIYKLLWKALQGQEINDDRSDSEESESEENCSRKWK